MFMHYIELFLLSALLLFWVILLIYVVSLYIYLEYFA